MYIIPAIDILDGKVVRLREGDYNQKTEYNVSIEDMIEQYQSNGTDFIHIIDLNGAKGDFSNQKALFEIIKKTDMKVQYGGGIRTIEQVTNLLDAGIHRVIVGTQAISNPDFLPELSKAFVKKVEFIRTHLENIPASANCCWLAGKGWRDAKLSLWAEFWPFPWLACKNLIEN